MKVITRFLKHIYKATWISCDGLKQGVLHEYPFRMQITVSIFLVPTAIYISRSDIEMILLLGSIIMVLMAEILNSAIEATIDRISLEKHELSKRAKDYGSAGVFLAIAMFFITWGIIIKAHL